MANKPVQNLDIAGAMEDMRQKQAAPESARPEQQGRGGHEPRYPYREEPYREMPEKRSAGRPPKGKLIPKLNPRTIYFDPETNTKMYLVKGNNRIDFKVLTLAATRYFLERYFHTDRLDPAGVDYVNEMLDKICE